MFICKEMTEWHSTLKFHEQQNSLTCLLVRKRSTATFSKLLIGSIGEMWICKWKELWKEHFLPVAGFKWMEERDWGPGHHHWEHSRMEWCTRFIMNKSNSYFDFFPSLEWKYAKSFNKPNRWTWYLRSDGFWLQMEGWTDIGESRVTFATENCSLVFYYFRKNVTVNHFRLVRLKMIWRWLKYTFTFRF